MHFLRTWFRSNDARAVIWPHLIAPFLMLVLLLGAARALAQEQQQARPGRQTQQDRTDLAGPSDLARDNLSRVAATDTEIEKVLRRDPGLMVELKRWVAKEATDHGQVVSDWDLTDQAILDRLSSDVKFRSVATRLLQRYGYLLPQVNPDSDLGKEQDLLLRERATRLMEAQGEGTGVRGPGPMGTSEQASLCDPDLDEGCSERSRYRTPPCDPQVNEGCTQQELPLPNRPERKTFMPAIPPGTNQAQAPNDLFEQTQNPSLLNMQQPGLQTTGNFGQRMNRAQGGISGSLSDSDTGDESSVRARIRQMQMQGGQMPLSSSIGLGQGIDSGSLPSTLDLSEALSGNQGIPSTVNGGGNRGPAYAFVPGSPMNGQALSSAGGGMNGTSFERPSIVHKPNPYADLPSLYDMYVRATSHPAALERFGQQVFENGTRDSDLIPMDLPVGPDYVVGPGDSLAINLWGGVSQRLFREVDREGRLTLPEVGPLLVSGRSLSEVQQSVQQALRTQFRDVSADVSLSKLRTIRVYVVGDVQQPGAYDISSLSTPLNALFYAGGPTAGGSLRVLRHYRGKELVQEVDVYDLLLHGVKSDIKRLESGDSILVPPIGAQVTVEGMVRRPAVYELRDEKNLAEVLDLAGGILPAAALEHIEVERLEAHQKRSMLSLDLKDVQDKDAIKKQLESFEIHDSDEVHLFPIAPYNEDAVYLEGHVLRPGRYSFRRGMKLTDLVASYKDLLPEPAEKYAEIVRLNKPDYRPSVESFDLAAALANPAAAPALEPLDTVRIFGRYDFEDAPSVSVSGEVRDPGTYRTSGEIHLKEAIQMAGGVTPDALMDNAQVIQYQPDSKLRVFSVNLQDALAGNPLDNVVLRPRDSILVHRNPAKVDPAVVTIGGEVAKPGLYRLTTNMTAADLIRMAGGLMRSADTDSADLTRFAVSSKKQVVGDHLTLNPAAALAGDTSSAIPLRDGDVLTIRQMPQWEDRGASVTLRGEVRHPGTYGIRPGERLSSVLKRAGGFLPTAYPEGALLRRAEVRKLQEESRQELIERIEQDAANVQVAVTESAQDQASMQQAAFQQHLRAIAGLKQMPITGRLVVRLRSNLAEFENSPDDVELRARDQVTIPKRPDFVIVTGQVYNSNAITYRARKSAAWYLRQAGGPTNLANKGDIFVVRANGSVLSGKGGGWWSGNALSAVLEPGDTIVVPEKPIGGSPTWKNLLSVAQIAQSASLVALVATR